MDGTEGERAAKSRKLAKTVELWSGLPVRMWDERQTTSTLLRAFKVIWGVMAVVRNSVRSQVARPVRLSP